MLRWKKCIFTSCPFCTPNLYFILKRLPVYTTSLLSSTQSNATSFPFSCILIAYPNHTPFPLRIPQRILWSSNLCRGGFFGGKHTSLELSAPTRQQQPPDNPDQHRLHFCVLCVLKCRNHTNGPIPWDSSLFLAQDMRDDIRICVRLLSIHTFSFHYRTHLNE